MDRKLIFLDIDGTLVAKLSSPTPAVREVVGQARANGHLVFLSTGRNLPIIGPDILEVGFDGVIASAGAYVAVAMCNACEELKAIADIICEDVDHDGLYWAFKKLGLTTENEREGIV